jgi:probable F420-dependent oxidoreductase
MDAESLGRYGAYLPAQAYSRSLASRVKALEDLGYGAIWIAGNAPADLTIPESILAQTHSVAVGTAIVNVWTEPANEVAASFHRLENRYPGRLLLGVGIGHRETNGDAYPKPIQTLSAYVDKLVELGVPGNRVILAALRTRVLQLFGDKAAGALAYFTTVEHTKKVRATLGADRILSVVQIVATGADRAANRSAAREYSERYLGLQKYVNNLRATGYPHLRVGDYPSDELLDALIPFGSPEATLGRIREHVQAGADHVPVLPIPLGEDPLYAFESIAAGLQSLQEFR